MWTNKFSSSCKRAFSVDFLVVEKENTQGKAKIRYLCFLEYLKVLSELWVGPGAEGECLPFAGACVREGGPVGHPEGLTCPSLPLFKNSAYWTLALVSPPHISLHLLSLCFTCYRSYYYFCLSFIGHLDGSFWQCLHAHMLHLGSPLKGLKGLGGEPIWWYAQLRGCQWGFHPQVGRESGSGWYPRASP